MKKRDMTLLRRYEKEVIIPVESHFKKITKGL